MSSQQPPKPPYNRNQNTAYTKSFRQSFSGSETDISNSTSTENLTQEEKHVLRHSTRQEPQGEENTLSHHHQQIPLFANSDEALIMHNYNSLKRYMTSTDAADVLSNRCTSVPPPHSFRMMSHEPVITSNINKKISSESPPSADAHLAFHPSNLPLHQFNTDATESSDQLRYQHHPIIDVGLLPPPPEYPKAISEPPKLSEETEKLCISEPDIISRVNNRPNSYSSLDRKGNLSQNSSTEMVAALSAENIMLKQQLDHYYRKVSKLQKVEDEVTKVHGAHEDLVKSSEKREKLERAVRVRMDLEIKRLQEGNKILKEQLDIAVSNLSKDKVSGAEEADLKQELHKRDMLISQLITQNKELVSDQKRQEIELSAQRDTLQEQRNHIDIMDNALTNAQANVVRLEEECRKKHAYVERVSQLQQALTSLQTACDKREQMEKKYRSKLEKEIETLRNQKAGSQVSEQSFLKEAEMKKSIRQHEEKVISLEAEAFKWEQRYLEESTMRQIAIDNASKPKDAKIAALEKTSQESEKLIAEARTEKLKQMDELYQSQRKCADIETRIKDLESKLAEKEAMIRVLQKQSDDKSDVIHSTMLRSPRHSPHTSILHKSSLSATLPITSSDGNGNLNSSVFAAASCDTPKSRENTLKPSRPSLPSIIYHKSSPSQSGLDTLSVSTSQASDDSCISTPTNCSSSTEKSLDEQLRDVESQLSSKDSIISALRAEKQKYPNHFWRV